MPSVIKIPDKLAHELDRLASAEHKPRTTYVVDVLWRDVRRNNQREALRLSAGAWNLADHPELAQGAAAHV
jgi:predicted transcriptional regulator